jgi:hypothetical protein
MPLEDIHREILAFLVTAAHPNQDPAMPDMLGVVVLVVFGCASRHARRARSESRAGSARLA